MNKNKNYINELIDITIQTSIHTLPFFGKMDKLQADKIAVDRMRIEFGKKKFKSRVIIGEGEKDDAPMLYENEILGNGIHEIDIAVDPLECTSNFAKGLPNSLSVIAYTEKDCMQRVPGTYMEQWIAGPKMEGFFEIEKGIESNIETLSDRLHKKKSELRIVVQDRPRHQDLISKLRKLDCQVCLIDSGSISCAVEICLETGNYDSMIGTFGAPEGIISAIIAKSTRSEFKSILRPHEEKYKLQWESYGRKEREILDKDELIQGEYFGFVATCISSNTLLKGIRLNENTFQGESIYITKNEHEIKRFERNKI